MYETVNLADVVGCRVEYGLDLRLKMRAGAELGFNLNRVPEKNRPQVIQALKRAAGEV